MKSSILKRVICICLAVFMLFSVAACGETEQNPTKTDSAISSAVESEETSAATESETENTESQTSEADTSSATESVVSDTSSKTDTSSKVKPNTSSKVQAGTNTSSKVQAGTTTSSKVQPSTSSKTQATSSKKPTNTSSKKPSSNVVKTNIKYNTPVSNIGHNGKDYSNYNPYKDIEKYRGTTVKFATWINHLNTEGAEPIKSFKEKYGINVELVYCSQNNYVEEILALIAAKKNPDMYVDGAMFPFTAQIAQDFSVTGVDLNEPIWSKPFINSCTVGNKVYAVGTINSPWNSISGVLFNRELMEANGIKTPLEYYEEGNWTWDTMKTVMQQVDNLGDEYYGGSIDAMDIVASTGASIVDYDYKTGVFKNTSDDPRVTKALQYVAGLHKENLTVNSLDKFANGKVGLAVQDPYITKRTGYVRTMDGLDLGLVPLPDIDKNTKAGYAARIRGYGIVKGAKNPKAAGLFIRYYLDAANYNLDKAFLSEDLGNVFFEINDAVAKSKSERPIYFNYTGIAHLTGDNGFAWYPAGNEPTQVATNLAAQNNKVNAAIDKANELMKTLK